MSGTLLSSPLFCFGSEAFPDIDLRVYRFSGHEAISKPFCFKITLVADSADLDLDAPVARPATFSAIGRMHLGIPYTRSVHGRIERFTQLHAGRRHSLYEAILSPTIFPLSHTRNSRIFQRLSTIDIVKQVLSDAGLPSDQLQTYLHSDYGKRDYCVQYQESDLAFVSRLLEEDGIFFFFRHANGHDILVLGDGPHAIESVPSASHLSHRDQPHLFEDVVHDFRAESAFRPGSTIVRDFRFKHPGIDMEARQSADAFADYQVYYYPGEYVDPELGQRIAGIRHEELQCQRRSMFAESSCPALLPGYNFDLFGHRRRSFNQEYLLTGVEHEGVQPQALKEEHVSVEKASYTNRFHCIPADVSYRPPRFTPRPQILGIQSAVVVGPPGDEIHCDEHGRVKVQFHWDRQGQRNDDSSCWVRTSQTWAGVGYGGTFLPRVGQEVLVQFLEGDPDRPVIVGRVQNGENVHAHQLPANKNISTIRTASTPGGDGFNEIRLDDTAKREVIFVHAQRDRDEIVGRQQTTRIGRSRRTRIRRNDHKLVGRNLLINVNRDHSLRIRQHSESEAQTILIRATQWLRLECNGGYILIDEAGQVHINGPNVYINCDENSEPGTLQQNAAPQPPKPDSNISREPRRK